MSDTPAQFKSDNPIVQRLMDGSAPDNIKLAAARGALPFTPEELLQVLYVLRDEPGDLPAAINKTLSGLDDSQLAAIVKNDGLDPGLLHFVAERVLTKEAALAALIGNSATPGETFELLARGATGTPLELIVTNQVRLIKTPTIIDALLANPALAPDQKRRVLEVREEFFVKKEREEKRRKDEESRLAKIREKESWTAAELEKLQNDLAKEAQADKESGVLTADEVVTEGDDSEEENLSASARLGKMSVPEKILLSLRGNRTERGLLIRDSNRLVCTGVIKSPKITEAEVESIAGMRNVNDEVLRIIGGRRDWLRNYQTLLILVKNPRTPIPTAMNLINRVQKKDMKSLSSDRNVSEQIRRNAKNIYQRMTKGGA